MFRDGVAETQFQQVQRTILFRFCYRKDRIFNCRSKANTIQKKVDLTIFYIHYFNMKETTQAILNFCKLTPKNCFFVLSTQVLRDELRAIKLACSQWGSNCNLDITFIVVQKRHHARFEPINMEYKVSFPHVLSLFSPFCYLYLEKLGGDIFAERLHLLEIYERV